MTHLEIEQTLQNYVEKLDIHDAAHDINHIKRVVKSARQIGIEEQADLNIVIPAAWLHDCVSFPKNHPNNKKASQFAADKAVELLTSLNYAHGYLDAIHHAIKCHSYSAGFTPETLEAKIVQDADRLDGLGAIGVSRCMMVAGKLDSKIYHLDDPFCQARTPDSKLAAVDHFYEKLFKTAQTMQTESGRREADSRVQFMRQFLQQLGAEIKD